MAIATDTVTDPASQVKELLKGHVHEFIEVANNPKLREVLTFEPLFRRVETTDPNQVTLYAHAKGVTHPPYHSCHRWTDILYTTLLDYWPVVLDALRKQPVAGSFRVKGMAWLTAPDGPSTSTWHYSGSYFWFRNKDLFEKPDWTKIDQFWSGIEPYPSLHFSLQEAGVVFMTGSTFQEDPKDWLNLYDPQVVQQRVEPELLKWLEANKDKKTVLGGNHGSH